MKISATIITKNEEQNIGRCLASLDWCDEIIVVDSFSSDKTVEIAKNFGAKVFCKKFEGFGLQKLFASENANGPWILSVDADEVVSTELAKSIRQLISEESPQYNYYRINIENYFMGGPLKYWMSKGHWHERLYLKSKAEFNNNLVHEKVVGEGRCGTLLEPIYHFSYRNIHHYIEKLNFYTDLSSKQSKDSNLLHVMCRSCYTFFNIYFIRGAIRNGKRGIIWSMLSAFCNLVKYLKIYENAESVR